MAGGCTRGVLTLDGSPGLDKAVREAVLSDLPAVGRLWTHYIEFHRQLGLAFELDENSAQAWTAGFERTLGRFSFIWVAESGGQLVGFLAARIKRVPPYLGGALVAEIADLWVEPEARAGGLAAGMCDLAQEKMRELQVHSIEVQVLSANQAAGDFWQARGFRPELVQYRLIRGGQGTPDA